MLLIEITVMTYWLMSLIKTIAESKWLALLIEITAIICWLISLIKIAVETEWSALLIEAAVESK